MDTNVTRVDSIKLTNFRGFSSLDVEFHPNLTVVVAPNGLGKTALLDAVAIAWRPLVDEMRRKPASSGFSSNDVRLVLSPEKTMEPFFPNIETTATVAGRPGTWTRFLGSVGKSEATTWPEAEHLRQQSIVLRQKVMDHAEGKLSNPPLLPAIAYYGAGRFWPINSRHINSVVPEETAPKRRAPDTSRSSGYLNCLSPSTKYRTFESWFGRFAREAQDELVWKRASQHAPRERMSAVRIAVHKMLAPTGWQQLEWDNVRNELAATHADHGRLPVSFLSDGIRSMIGMAGDLAHRCVSLNPHLGKTAAAKTPGIVLIDEVDMHLHPAWQQQVLGALRNAFPLIQLIVTTHSPQVLTTVRAESVRILSVDNDGVGCAAKPQVSTLGREAGDALAYVFETDSKPMGLQLPSEIGVVDAVHRVEQYIRAGRENEQTAQDLLGELKAFGVQIPEVDLKLWRFMAGRNKEG